eukprot:2275688-Prymnesium_polylepis.1
MLDTNRRANLHCCPARVCPHTMYYVSRCSTHTLVDDRPRRFAGPTGRRYASEARQAAFCTCPCSRGTVWYEDEHQPAAR